MLRAYLEHEARNKIDAELTYVFVEHDDRRFEWLVKELNLIQLPLNVKVYPVHGEFAEVLGGVLGGLGGAALAPTFLFVDPFGYADNPMETSTRVLSFPRCEVLIYVPLRWIARFISDDGAAAAYTSLYGDDRWMTARQMAAIDDRVPVLRDLFEQALQEHAPFVSSFEMLDAEGTHGYHLFFGTHHVTGLSRMKRAMWSVDPGDGASFRDPRAKGQQVLFAASPDFEVLLGQLQSHFGKRTFSIEEAEQFVLLETPFMHDSHLKRETLAPAERDGVLEVLTRRAKRMTYPKGTVMRFRAPDVARPDHRPATRPTSAHRAPAR